MGTIYRLSTSISFSQMQCKGNTPDVITSVDSACSGWCRLFQLEEESGDVVRYLCNAALLIYKENSKSFPWAQAGENNRISWLQSPVTHSVLLLASLLAIHPLACSPNSWSDSEVFLFQAVKCTCILIQSTLFFLTINLDKGQLLHWSVPARFKPTCNSVKPNKKIWMHWLLWILVIMRLIQQGVVEYLLGLCNMLDIRCN